jgi:hypothetical protein
MAKPALSRRDWLQLASAGVVGFATSDFFRALAQEGARHPRRKRACILLWMNGGPSQIDTFDLKPGHANGGPFKEIQTKSTGLRWSEHLPKLAEHSEHVAVIRSMSTREGDHSRGTFYMRTGYLPQGPIQYPTLGSLIAKELTNVDSPLPDFVSIAPYRAFSPQAYGSGFLGPQYAPLILGETNPFVARQTNADQEYQNALRVPDLLAPDHIPARQMESRVALLGDLQRDFVARHPEGPAPGHQSAYNRAVKLMQTSARTAFNLDDENASLRDSYGRNLFGQGCLLARRLVERGVPFVEVTLGALGNNNLGWDTHADNFNQVRRLSEVLDPAWATLISDLKDRGLLETTTIVWMGEFGRTPAIRGNGRDHYPNAWTTVLAGGGIKGGQAYGATSADGAAVEGRAVSVPDFMATIHRALGINPETANMSNVGRPIRLADHGARPVTEVLA